MPTPEDEPDAKAVTRQPSPSELAAQRILVLLQSAHEENQVTAAHEFQHLAKADIAVALAADVLHLFVAMLRTEQMQLQAAAAAALAGLCTSCSGRDAARLSGALQQLVHVVQEQQKDPGCSAAEHAAKALMNAAACDAAKATIHRAGGVPSLMQLLRCGSDLGVLPFAGKPCPAAVYAVGALLNMVLVKQIRATLVKLDGMALLEDVAAQHFGNVLGARSAVSLLQLQLTTSHFQPPEGPQSKADAEEIVEAATELAGGTASSSTPSQPDTPVTMAAPPKHCAAQAAAVADVTQPLAAVFGASFAAAFAGARPVPTGELSSAGGAGMQVEQRRSAQPEAPAATCGSRMVTFDIPIAAATPEQPADGFGTLNGAAVAAAADTVSPDKIKQSNSSGQVPAAAAKKPVAPPPAPHSQPGAKARTQRAVGKAAGIPPKGLAPSKAGHEPAAQQPAKIAGASVAVGRVCFPA